MKRAYISIGSNLGDRAAYLRRALDLVQEQRETRLVQVSSLYETEPVGGVAQGKFLNAVFSLDTALGPYELLRVLQEIEVRLGRKRDLRWGSRTVDLDILCYGDTVLEDLRLTLPHPRLAERAFVLVPLVEIAPSLEHPLSGKTMADYLEALADQGGVVRLAGKWEGEGDFFA